MDNTGLTKANIMVSIFLVVVLLFIHVALAQNNRTLTTEEFHGPFSSWTSVTTYGANGSDDPTNSANDDTAAIQAGLDALGSAGHAVLYFPAGTYRISSTLTLRQRGEVMIIGHAPSDTTLVWYGATSGATMLLLDGVRYSSVRRFTFDGRTFARALIEQSWNAGDATPGYFDTGNEYTDIVFKDGGYGILGGDAGGGFAETTVARCDFYRASHALATANFNALDLWVWDSYFQDNGNALKNFAGNYFVFRSLFRGSTIADLNSDNTMIFGFRGNMSINAKKFLYHLGSGSSPLLVQSNTILDPVDALALVVQTSGPFVMLDNVVRSRTGVTGPVVDEPDIIAIGNTFTASSPFTSLGSRDHNVDTSIVSIASINPPELQLPKMLEPPGTARHLEEPATAGAIQGAITTACTTYLGQRPVVHIAQGTYNISTGLTVSAGCDVQLIGDGYATILNWTGAGGGTLLTLTGPTKATIRDMTLKGNGSITLSGTNVNQTGGRVTVTSSNSSSSTVRNTEVTGLTATTVDMMDLQNVYSTGSGAAFVVDNATVRVFSGHDATQPLSNEVKNGGTLILRDGWFEGAPQYMNLSSVNGIVVLDHRRVAPSAYNQAEPAIRLQNFAGEFVIVGSDVGDRLLAGGSGTGLNIALLGMLTHNNFSTTPIFLTNTTSSAVADARVFQLHRFNQDNSTTTVTDGTCTGTCSATWDDPWVKARLAPTRNVVVPAHLAATGANVTDLRLDRVNLTLGSVNLKLDGTPVSGLTPIPLAGRYLVR